METYGGGYSGVWNIFSEVPFDNVIISVCYYDLFWLGLCYVVYFCSYVVYWSLEKMKGLQGALRSIKVLLLRLWFTMDIINIGVYYNVPETYKGISLKHFMLPKMLDLQDQ